MARTVSPWRRVAARGAALACMLAGTALGCNSGASPPDEADSAMRGAGVPAGSSGDSPRDGGIGGPARAHPIDAGGRLEAARSVDGRPVWKTGERLGALLSVEYATLTVPIDYDDPSGHTLELALARVRSQATAPNGTLLFNPGGPGVGMVADAAAYLQQFSVLFPTKDVVLMDNRGTGQSTPLQCLPVGDAAELEPSAAPDAGSEARLRARGDFGEAIETGCLARFGERLRFFNTENVARDMESVRAALGVETIDFWGASYGALQGALYATLFPSRVGTWVLEAPFIRQPEGTDSAELAFRSAAEYEMQLDRFFLWCDSNCDPEVEAMGGAAAAYDRLNEQLQAGVGFDLESEVPPEALNVVAGWSLRTGYWDLLQTTIEEALFGNWAPLLYVFSSDGSADSEQAMLDATAANVAILHLDNDCRDRQLSDLTKRYDDAVAAYPRLGATYAEAAGTCLGWRTAAAEPALMTTDVAAPPLLVMAALNDPATPYTNAVTLIDQLNNGSKLVTTSNEGHGATTSECGLNVLLDVMLSGDVTAAPERCEAPPPPVAPQRNGGPDTTAAQALRGLIERAQRGGLARSVPH